jgi:hypothetical protein
MKPTKEILDLIEKRRKYGALANSFDSKVHQWCEEHGIDDTTVMLEYGCMLTTEPDTYADLTLKLIENISE